MLIFGTLTKDKSVQIEYHSPPGHQVIEQFSAVPSSKSPHIACIIPYPRVLVNDS